MAIIFSLAQLFSKIVLILYYLRLSPLLWYINLVRFFGFCIIGNYTGIFFSSLFGCRPIAKGWNPFLEGTCIDVPSLYQATALSGVLIDLILILLPIPIVYKLQVPLRQKLCILSIFGVGSM